jgi:hypothetical protein
MSTGHNGAENPFQPSQEEKMKALSWRFVWVCILVVFLYLGLGPASQAEVNDPEQLVSFFRVELPGWQVKEGYPKWERVKGKQGSYLEAQVIYTSGQSTLTAVIMKGEITNMIDQIKGFPETTSEKGYCRKTIVQGFQAIEIHEKIKRSGFLFILVAEDCMIPMEGKEVDSTKSLMDLISRIDLQRLAALVK